MLNILQQLAQNESQSNELKNFFITYLQKTAIDKVFKKENVVGLAEAGEILEKAFEALEDAYITKPKNIIINENR